MTTGPDLSTLARNRAREVATVAFYVAVTLAAELAAASSDDSSLVVVGALWGTAIGLALAHWYASTVTSAVARRSLHRTDAVEALREVGAAVAVAVLLTLPFLIFQTPTALVVARWSVVVGTSGIAFLLALAEGTPRLRAAVEATIVFAIGVAVIETKAAITH